MNAVIDEDLHRSLKPVLESLGFTVFDIRDHGLRGYSDSEIFSFAQQKKAVLRFPNELSIKLINQRVFQLLSQLNEKNYRAGSSRLERDSIVLGVGSRISIKRLCTSISKCSRAFLSTWGEDVTTINFRSVGKGTGPDTLAPVAKAVSSILAAVSSTTRWSKDFSRTRSLPFAILKC
ncbi:MAG: hypothetical protein UY06_C0038G0013 [Candidatus Amesbacteria bacterium GW2011_GWA2_47_70]|nr:MAG: hypothetical protein UY06_C0038G0013 [Candidatus Amesbacteria bacterium GW2011_GWA2_47_70]